MNKSKVERFFRWWFSIKPKLQMEKVLFATDELSGLIGACAMVRPSKSVCDMDLASIRKKFKKKEFSCFLSLSVAIYQFLNKSLTIM